MKNIKTKTDKITQFKRSYGSAERGVQWQGPFYRGWLRIRLTIRSLETNMVYKLLYKIWVQFSSRRKTGHWLVALRKGCPLVGSFRGLLGVRLTIRSPKVGLGSYMGYRPLYQLQLLFTPRRKTCDAPKPGTGLQPCARAVYVQGPLGAYQG